MVGLVVVSHSARLADGVVELASQMAEDVRLEAAGGVASADDPSDDAIGTDAARVMDAIEAADEGDGALVLMDLGSAVLSAETAVELLDPELAERVRLSPAPLVEGAVAAAVAAQAGASLDEVAAEAMGGLAPKAAHLGEAVGAGADAGAAGEPEAGAAGEERQVAGPRDQQIAAPASDAVEARFTVTVAQGLHARPAARFVRAAAAREARIEVTNATTGAGPARAGSLNAIATLGVREGHDVLVRATGPEAQQAIDELRAVATEGAPVSAGRAEALAGAGAEATGGTSAPPAEPPFDAAVGAGAEAGGEGREQPPDTGPRAAGERREQPPDTGPRAAGERREQPPDAGARAAGEGREQPPDAGARAAGEGREQPPDAGARAAGEGREQPVREAANAEPTAGTPLNGLPASPGIAIGPVRQFGVPVAPAAIDDVPAGDPDEEWAALEAARDRVRMEIEERRERLAREVGPEEAEILEALALILDDEAILEPVRDAIYSEGLSAARAWADEIATMAQRYHALDDPYQRARAADLEDVGRRVLAALAGEATTALSGSGILVTHDLTPIDAAGLDPQQVAGIATAVGGPTSHGAILARALGVPAVVGIGAAVLRIPDGTRAILDGNEGVLLPDPPPEVERRYAERLERERATAEEARRRAHEPALTRDGIRIEVAANAGSPEDAREAVAHGADGIGLLRTEFAFLGRASEPSEDEQVEIYSAVAEALQGRPLVIRTLDAGADKPLPYLRIPAEENPFLGVRGVRLGLARPELLRTQLRAILRTAAAYENVKLMFPMIATIEELRAARALLNEAWTSGPEPIEPRAGFEVGIMIEVPSAALTAMQLAHEVDFFSIGTNDLTQYALAAERGNAAVASLADGLHPAVLRLIGEVCDAARAHDRWVGICGELGADPAAVPLLVGLGVRELSVAAPSVPAVKAAVRELDTREAARLAGTAVARESAGAVRALVVSDR